MPGDLPLSLLSTLFLKELPSGEGRWDRRQAWSHRAELLMQSMNPAIPCQARQTRKGPSVSRSLC